jgi:hypothetical protein
MIEVSLILPNAFVWFNVCSTRIELLEGTFRNEEINRAINSITRCLPSLFSSEIKGIIDFPIVSIYCIGNCTHNKRSQR